MPTYRYTTRAQHAAAERARYATATGMDAVKWARSLVSGKFTDAELQVAFGLPTLAAVNSLKGRLRAQDAKWKAVEQAVGE